MKFACKNSDAKKFNPWVWFGVIIALLVVMDDKSGVRRKIELKRQDKERAQAKAMVFGQHSADSRFFDGEPLDRFLEQTIDVDGLDSRHRVIVVDTDKIDGDRRRTRRGSVESRAEIKLTEEQARDRSGTGNVRAGVVGPDDAKIRELERKIADAGEKIRQAAEKAGAKVSERSRNVIVSRILGEKFVPPVPPVPPVPAGLSRDVFEKMPEAQKFQVRSRPCATREKSIAEARTNLEKIVGSRLSQYGLEGSEFVAKAVESLHTRFEVEESFREVGGDRYPLYVASAEVDLGANFERQALRLVNQQTAHRRFSSLMGLSFGVIVLLLGVDQMVLGRSRTSAASGKNLV